MPGRQAHGRPLLADPNKKRKGNKKSQGGNGGNSGGRANGVPSVGRSSGGAPRTRQGGRVDVMALAEQQIGESRAKGVRVRDLEVEREQGKRRRNDSDDDEGDDDDEEAPKRRRPNNDGDKDGDGSSDEIHSDSSGNEWREGVGSDDDDSEIDSDEAFGDSDDDEIFDAFAFRGSSSKQNKNKKNKTSKTSKKSKDAGDFDGFDDDDDDVSDEDVGDDGADLGDEAIDLAAALDIVSSDEDEAEASSTKQDKSRKKKSRQADDSDVSASDVSMSGSDDDDSNSDSDGQSSTASSDFDSDDEDEEDEDEEDEEDAGFSKSDALQSIASAYAAGDSDANDDSDDEMAHAANPYQFNASLGSKDRSLKKSITAAVSASSDKTLDVPLLPMQQDRQLRVAAAEKAHETLDRWTETVKHNRRAEHVAFDVAGSLVTSGLDTANLMPINQASAQTDLEKTILSIMEESGLGAKQLEDDRARQKKQQREAAAAELSPEALQAIIGQKRRARELQSREQARAKRIKKIKSKAYRRVHRRERQRAEDALDDSDAEHDSDEDKDSEAERDAAHRRRAMERMGARHRESRWAKRAKNTNRAAWDDEFRAGLVDMARQDEELRRRVDGAGVGGGPAGASDDSDSDSFDEESDEEAFKLRTKEKLAKAGGAGAEEEPKGLMAIAFMQKAELARKKANDEAVAEIMRDLDQGDDSDEDMIRLDDDGGDDDETADRAVGRRTYGPAANGGKPASSRPARQQKAVVGGEAAAASETPAAKPSHAKDVSNTFPARKASAPGDAGSWTVVGKTGTSDKTKSKKTNGDAGAAPGLTSDGRLMMTAVVDDVLAQNKAAEDRAAAKDKARDAAAAKKAAAAVARASQAADESETSSSGSDSEDDTDDADHRTAHRSKYFQLRAENELLLRKALGEDDAAAEFAAEKAAQAAEEAAAWEDAQAHASGRRNKNSATSMPGWGSWVGDGVSKRAIKRDQRLAAAAAGGKGGKGKAADDKKALVRRDAKLDKVIISEKRIHKNDKYMASQLPHEYETRMQYERSLRLPVGPEWSTTFAFQDATKPRVLKKQGVVLPMAKPQM